MLQIPLHLELQKKNVFGYEKQYYDKQTFIRQEIPNKNRRKHKSPGHFLEARCK